MSASDVLPYLVVALFPILLLALYALFRWRYLRSVGTELYKRIDVTGESTEAQSPLILGGTSTQARHVELTWAEAADVVTQAKPATLIEAYRRTRSMRAAFAASGLVFTVCTGAVVGYALLAHGSQLRSAWSVGSLSTLSGLFVTLVFARPGWARSVGAVLIWIALQLTLLMVAAKVSLTLAASLIVQSVSLNGIPILGAGLLALRTTRVLTVAFMPALGLLIVVSTGVVVILDRLGIRVEGTPTVSGMVLGAAALAIGLFVIIRQIRDGLNRRFVALWLSATGLVALIAWLTGNDVWAPVLGVGVNGSLILLWWVAFKGFLQLKTSGHLPDEVLHFSGCLFGVLVWIGALTGVQGLEVLLLLIPFGAHAVTLWLLLRKERRSEPSAPALLLLRVFHQTPRDSWIIDTLDDSWRRAGRLDLTVGLDLALRAINTVALENFFLGKVNRYFFRSPKNDLDRLARLPRTMALDGRYPLNELHCHLDTWEWVVETLVRDARVVVMDLRGLRLSNTGALQELSIVIPRVPLSQIVILSDRSTDERLLAEGIREAWSAVRPGALNFHRSNGTMRLLRCSGTRRLDARALDWAVFTAASSEPTAPASVVDCVAVM